MRPIVAAAVPQDEDPRAHPRAHAVGIQASREPVAKGVKNFERGIALLEHARALEAPVALFERLLTPMLGDHERAGRQY